MTQQYTIYSPGIGGFRDVVLPEPMYGQAWIRPEYIGLCGSDALIWKGEMPAVTYPRVPCHEMAGVVTRLGWEVKHLKVGDRVVVDPYKHCGRCAACKVGRYNCCQHNQTLGVQRDGILQREVLVEAERCHRVAYDTDVDLLALAEPIALGLHIIERAGNVWGKRCMVVGVGNVGGLVTRLLRQRDAEVYAVVKDVATDWRRAQAAGAQHIYAVDPSMAANGIVDPQVDIEIAFECAGTAQAVELCLKGVQHAGTVVLVGHSRAIANVKGSDIVFKELDIRGSRNASPEQFSGALRELNINPDLWRSLITHTFTFNNVEEALKLAASDRPHGKVMIQL